MKCPHDLFFFKCYYSHISGCALSSVSGLHRNGLPKYWKTKKGSVGRTVNSVKASYTDPDAHESRTECCTRVSCIQ